MKYILTVFTLFIPYCISAQSVCKLSQQELDLYLCVNDYTSIESSASLTLGLSEIVSEIGLSQSNFTMKTCNSIKNAVAVIIDGERELLIDENYLSKLNNSTNSSFYLFILAHEIGHHLNGHTLKSSDNSTSRKQELEADYFAGFVLKKLDGSIQDITDVLNNIPHPNENIGTHPILKDRIFIAESGFNNAELKEQEILQKFETEITEKIKNAEKINTLNLARSLYYKYAKTGNMEFFDSSRRFYEELINKNLFGNIPFIELSYLHKLNDDSKSSIQILNEIQNPNSYTALLLYENYNKLEQSIPNEIETILSNIVSTSVEGLTYRTILANYYLNTGKTESAKKIFNSLLTTIEESDKEEINKYELIHFYSNYSYFLNTQSEFEQSVEISKNALDLIKTSEYLNNNQVNSIFKSCYNTYSVALLGSKNYTLLEQSLTDWRKLDLTQNEINEDFLYLTARLQEETGKTKEAIKSFQLYLELNNDPFANFHLGKCYLENKKSNSACSEFKIACANGVELACRYLKIKCDD
ncbi:M48 family metalloprotease [Algibacter pectinivorans]|uniref:Tetratricopeptide repeat-containing protein n=1 Tax=Algibacter pectinivorans TaxID=870482 RepID=A0A1I1SAX3_9FLAO|nr:M48 family metalloprotease [Algibacter pectinivorans]SFD41758.1 Tetratricopeptide repeat-containing protein [Algibacter pectinivorans]